jgi:hypothetical protein
MRYNLRMIRLSLFLTLLLFLPLHASAAGMVYAQSQTTEVLGTTMGAALDTSISSTKSVLTTTNLISLGTALNALSTLTSPPNTINGTSYTEVYSFGRRVFADASYLKMQNGGLLVGLAPTEIRVPAVMYPVGPMILRIDGGARFQANLTLNNATEISIPLQYSAPGVQLSAVASAAGFVEGYSQLVVLRGGVGGQIDLLDSKMSIATRFQIDGSDPVVLVSAIASFLNGRIYAFVDVFGIFEFGWKRLIDKELYQRNGYCFAYGAMQCPGL